MVITFHFFREKNRANYQTLHVSQQSTSVRNERPSGCHVIHTITEKRNGTMVFLFVKNSKVKARARYVLLHPHPLSIYKFESG